MFTHNVKKNKKKRKMFLIRKEKKDLMYNHRNAFVDEKSIYFFPRFAQFSWKIASLSRPVNGFVKIIYQKQSESMAKQSKGEHEVAYKN